MPRGKTLSNNKEVAFESNGSEAVDLFEHAPVGYLTLDAAGIILKANATAASMLGKASKDMLGLPYSTFIRQADQAKFAGHIEQCLAHDGRVVVELTLLSPAFTLVQQISTRHRASPDAPYQIRTVITTVTEEQILLEQLERTRVQLENAMESARLAVWSWNLTTDELVMSANAPAILGISPEAIYKTSAELFEHIHPDDVQTLRQILDNAIATGKDFTAQIRLTSASTRKATWVEGHGRMRRNRKGEPAFIEGVVFGIDDRKRIEAMLQRQAEFIDLSPDAMFARTIDGTITTWSKGAERLYGYTAEEAVGGATHDLLKTRFPEPLEKIIETLRREGVWNGELVHATRDGRDVIVQSRWLMIPETDDRPAEMFESNVDITERKQAEQALRQSEARFRMAIKHSEIAVWACDKNLRFTWMYNPRLGNPPEDLVGKTASEVLGEDKVREMEDGMRQALQTGQGARAIVKVLDRKGLVHYFDQHVEPLQDMSGDVIGVMGVSLDVTERMIAEERMRSTMEGFRTMVAHSTVPVALVDEKGVIEGISKLGANILGYEDSELVGISVGKLIHISSRLEIDMRLRDLHDNAPMPARAVLRLQSKDGTSRWASLEGSIINFGQVPERYLIRFEVIPLPT